MKECGRSVQYDPLARFRPFGSRPPGPPQRTSAESSTFSHPAPGSGSGRRAGDVPEMEDRRGLRGPVAAEDEKGFFRFEGSYLHAFPIRPGKDRIGLPDPDQFAVELQEEGVISRFPERRVRTGAKHRSLVLGIGDLALPAEGGELLFPPFPDRLDEGGVAMMHEVEERGNLAVLFPHEQEWKEGGKQDDARGELLGLEADQAGEPVPAHPVPHLVVVLREHDEFPGGEVARRVPVPAPAVRRMLPGVDEPVREGPGHVARSRRSRRSTRPVPRSGACGARGGSRRSIARRGRTPLRPGA